MPSAIASSEPTLERPRRVLSEKKSAHTRASRALPARVRLAPTGCVRA